MEAPLGGSPAESVASELDLVSLAKDNILYLFLRGMQGSCNGCVNLIYVLVYKSVF